MLVDSHCHLEMLDLAPYDGKIESVIKEANSHGIDHILSVCVQLSTFPNILSQAKQLSGVTVSCGLHPNEEPGFVPEIEDLLSLASDEKVVAIGETGLDTYRSEGDLEWQHERFRRHIEVAKRLNKALIVHTREAKEDTLHLLREESAGEVGGVIHCFTEDWAMASACLDMNFDISFSGIVTFKNAKALQDVARKVPLERMLVETDAPYLTPVPNRGKPNYPTNVRHVAQFIADLKGVSLETLARVTTENFFRIFPTANKRT